MHIPSITISLGLVCAIIFEILTTRRQDYILMWILCICITLWMGMCVRYHYSISDRAPTLLHREYSSTFEASLLTERRPIVCSGFEHTQLFRKLRMHPLPEDEIYTHVRHIQPWCSSAQAIVKETPRPTPASAYQQCDADACILIQTRGTSSVWLVHPHDKETPPANATPGPASTTNQSENVAYTEVILREGTGLFVPFQWWYSMHPPSPTTTTEEADDTADAAPESVIHKLGWKSPLSSVLLS